MADTLKLTQHQARDVEAASELVYAEAADEVIDTRTLGRDFVALVTIFLIIVTYHITNPLLLHQVQFGSAFRNATLQPVMAISLVIVTLVLISRCVLKRSGAGDGRKDLPVNAIRSNAWNA